MQLGGDGNKDSLRVLKRGPRVCLEGIRRKDVLDGCGLSKEPFIEACLCNRLYVMVGSRVLDTCHPVHTERVRQCE